MGGLRVQEYDFKALFQLLDFDNTGTISLDEVAFGLQRLHGEARSIDIARIMHETQKLGRQIASIESSLEKVTSSVKKVKNSQKHSSVMGVKSSSSLISGF